MASGITRGVACEPRRERSLRADRASIALTGRAARSSAPAPLSE